VWGAIDIISRISIVAIAVVAVIIVIVVIISSGVILVFVVLTIVLIIVIIVISSSSFSLLLASSSLSSAGRFLGAGFWGQKVREPLHEDAAALFLGWGRLQEGGKRQD
jgi:type IV secretory pathway VirB3-like protein